MHLLFSKLKMLFPEKVDVGVSLLRFKYLAILNKTLLEM